MQATIPPSEVPGYRLQQFLGAGAFGQVWVGQDLNTGRSVAVKFYLHRGGVNWSLLSREVKNLVQLSADRHVVQVLEVGWEADPPYYVMELVTGGSLEDMLKIRGRLPVTESVELFRKICIGLNHCHGKGVLHCDVKPANILIAEDNEPRLADFGQSRMSHDQTPTLGTLFYMAPEQADLKATPDASWDVYAAGAILYRMLAGSPPHRDDDLVGKMDTAGSLPKRLTQYREAIEGSPPPAAHQERRGVDRHLARIVAKCLAADPSERYHNVQQILDDLARRDVTRARRPLMLLGIVGPILLLCTTCFFGARSINLASDDTKIALRVEATGSNQLAARFAARTLESEIERYFTLANEESARTDLQSAIQTLLDDRDAAEHLDAISLCESAAVAAGQTEAREQLLDEPSRVALDAVLKSRLARYTEVAEDSRRPRLASMFVTDARGTIVGIAYDAPVSRDQNSAGRNYSYRTYFHGGKDDLPKSTSMSTIDPLPRTHLSAAFQSTATGLWKVASSTPIDLDDDGSADAVFVVTINLGDFKLLQSERGANQIAVLIEARDGPLRGTVLQHPLMDEMRGRKETLAGKRFQVEAGLLDELVAGRGDVKYVDPLAASAGSGSAYGGEWIAAVQPVQLPQLMSTDDASDEQFDEMDGQTDLLVLVQYRLSKVLAPVTNMRRALLLEGAGMIASIFLITLALWLLLYRVTSQDSEPQETREPTPDLIETMEAK